VADSIIDIPPKIPANLGKFVLDPLNHAIAAGEREALKIGVPTEEVLEMLLNHVASVIAMIEPAGVRAGALMDANHALPELVRKHVEARHLSSGGVFMPNSTRDVLAEHEASGGI
jgi:hypothetical protein